MSNFKDFLLGRKEPYDGLFNLQIKYNIKLPLLLLDCSRDCLPEISPKLIDISIKEDIYTGLVFNDEFIIFSGFIPDSDIEFALENDCGFEGQVHNFFKFAFNDSNQGGFFIDLNEADYGKIYSIENYNEREKYIEKNIVYEIITVANSFEEFQNKISLYKIRFDSKKEKVKFSKVLTGK